MKFHSTRSTITTNASNAILQGLSPDGGLYVPTHIPSLDYKDCINNNFQEIAFKVLSLFFDEFETSQLQDAINLAYNESTFDHPKITNLRKIDETQYLLELFHGRTSAFKDLALSIYPHLLKLAMKQENVNHLTIITATSGDTGKAAMEAVADVQGLSIVVLYPHKKVSPIQEFQMITQAGDNVLPIAVLGNFDDAQSFAKNFFIQHPNLKITSANSMNIARLLPQVIYYYDAYTRLNLFEELIDVYVPTGNFGNILAAFIAREMGLPIRKLIVCTNDNNVLHDFFTTGCYDISERHFMTTHSPSMDILVSSNLERLLYFIYRDTHRVSKWMKDLDEKKKFQLNDQELRQLQNIFSAQKTSNDLTVETIQYVYHKHNILIDPHTATAIPQDTMARSVKKLIVSTASPYKFPYVYKEVFNLSSNNEFMILNEMENLSSEVFPRRITNLKNLTIRFKDIAELSNLDTKILNYIEQEETL